MKKKYYIFQMNSLMLNIVSTVLLVILFLLTIFIKQSFSFNEKDLMWICLLMIPYLCFHEVLHSIGYVLHGADFNRITYGAHIEKGILCCLCKQRVSKKCILISLLYPFMFIGVITYIIGMVYNIQFLIMLSIINLSGCSGDLLMFFNFVGLKDFEYSEFDDPISFGLYSDKDFSKKKLFGLKYIETVDTLKQDDLKKISISKVSLICFIFIIVVSILGIIL